MRSSPTVPPSSPAPGPSTVARDALRQHALDQGIAAVDLPGVGVTDRRVRLDGAYNFRDIGGLVGADGRRVRTGRVYRSDHLNDLSDADLGVIGALGLRAIHDFRLDSEVERQPSRLPTDPPIDVIRCPTGDVPGDTSAVDVVRDILAGLRPVPPADFWDENYLLMLAAGQPMFATVMASLARPEGLPAMYHCTGGKDRTGISTALLLELLGVADNDIIDDFLLTNLYRTPYRVAALRDGLAANGVDVVATIPIIGVCRSAMERARGELRTTYGGAEGYLVGGGLDPAVPHRLRDLLLEPA